MKYTPAVNLVYRFLEVALCKQHCGRIASSVAELLAILCAFKQPDEINTVSFSIMYNIVDVSHFHISLVNSSLGIWFTYCCLFHYCPMPMCLLMPVIKFNWACVEIEHGEFVIKMASIYSFCECFKVDKWIFVVPTNIANFWLQYPNWYPFHVKLQNVFFNFFFEYCYLLMCLLMIGDKFTKYLLKLTIWSGEILWAQRMFYIRHDMFSPCEYCISVATSQLKAS